jgi:hypothetical protein
MAMLTSLLTEGDEAHVPVTLCLDVGHQCVPGTSGQDRDPYAWLEQLGSAASRCARPPPARMTLAQPG